MKSQSPYSVLDAASNLDRLDPSYWKALISGGFPNLEVIAAPTELGSPQPEPANVRHILDFAGWHYGWTVADLGGSLNLLAMSVISAFDELLLVTTLEIPALQQAKRITRALVEGGYDRDRLRLVLNRVPKAMEVTPDEIEQMLGLPAYATLPNDYSALYECYSEGHLLAPSGSLGKQFARLAAKLAGLPEEDSKSKTRSKLSLFGFRGKERNTAADMSQRFLDGSPACRLQEEPNC
jgi:pilus assembly protein CpaE